MGFLDSIFGSGPEVNTQTLDTLTSEQSSALNQLISQLSGGGGRRFEGDVTVDRSNLEGLSLEGLESRALALSDPNRNNELFNASAETLLKFLDFEGQTAGVDDFFNANIRDPALESFREEVLPQIGRSFGGSNFFGSERQGADNAARDDLLKHLSRSRADITFRTDQAAKDRAIQAIGLAGEVDSLGRRDSEELLKLFAAGQDATGLDERNVGREFTRFLAEAGLDDTQIQQLLASINTQAIENVITVTPGSSGILGTLLSAAGAAGGFGSLFGGLFGGEVVEDVVSSSGRSGGN